LRGGREQAKSTGTVEGLQATVGAKLVVEVPHVRPDRVHRYVKLAGDVGLVKRNCGHYVENTGDDDLIMIETFRSDHYEEVSLANWLSHLPPKLVSAHLNIPEETLAMFPRGAQGTVPLP
jgi:oxalate decarboxylase/phosphoglucose isomerase-like protein (cupin superfamily)